jgi:hypothetical protein
LADTKVPSKLEQIVKLSELAQGYVEVPGELLAAEAGCTFSDIGGHGKRGAPRLRGQAVKLTFGPTLSDKIGLEGQLVSTMPGTETLMSMHCPNLRVLPP